MENLQWVKFKFKVSYIFNSFLFVFRTGEVGLCVRNVRPTDRPEHIIVGYAGVVYAKWTITAPGELWDIHSICDMINQGKWFTCRKCQFLFSYTTFSKLQNTSFWCKPHYNWISCYRVMNDFTMLNQYETKEFEHSFCR